jgi:HlyD family secretion protein
VRRLEASLGKTLITAPISGTVVDRLANQGETVTAGQGLCTLVDLTRLRLEVEVDEFDASRIELGAPVRITAEGYDGKEWRGKVEDIPDTVVSRRLRPQDPSRPVDVRVLLVKVALQEPTPLKLGQRVEVRIGRL